MSNEAPGNPQDKLNDINETIRKAEEIIKNAFSVADYINSIYSLTCMENDFKVSVNNNSVKVESIYKGTEEVEWKGLQKVSIVTNDKGPFTADVFMVLIGDLGACTVPQGNDAYTELYEKVTAFENVNFQNVIAAMSSSENKEFVIWEKKTSVVNATLSYVLFHCHPSTQPPFKIELGMSDKSAKEISGCAHIPDALQKLEELCKKDSIEKSGNFTLIYPIYLEAMDSDYESTMHNIAWLVKEQADKNKWNFDRTGGYTGKSPSDFI